MISNTITYLFIGILTCTIGALPLGLVNLSMIDAAVNQNVRKSIHIAFGAALVEICFALIAIVASAAMNVYFNNNFWIKGIVISVLIISAIVFWMKKSDVKHKNTGHFSSGILKGIILNVISIQVFMFWLLAITFLTVRDFSPSTNAHIVLFILGVWIGKISVLQAYAHLGKKVTAHSPIISQNINRIIGFVLMVVAVFQLVQF